MKKTIAPLLVLNILGGLPDGALSFTARPLARNAIRTTHSAPLVAPRQPTQLHGLLPDVLTRNKDDTAETDASATAASEAMTTNNGEEEEENLMQKVKAAGTAGVISYAAWELAFWGVSIPVCVLGYRELTGHWPDLKNSEDIEKVGAEAFAFVNFARFAVPLRIGLALSTTGWIDENIVQKFMKKNEDAEGSDV